MATGKQVLKVKAGLLNDPESFHEAKGGTEYYQGLKDLGKEGQEIEAMTNPADLISRQDHPVTLSYNGLALIVPPRGSLTIADIAKLGGSSPKGIYVVPRPDLRVQK